MTESNKRLRSELSALEDELADALDQSQDTVTLKAEVAILQERLDGLESNDELETLRKQHSTLRQEYDAVWVELEEHQERVVALEQQLATPVDATSELEEALADKQDELSAAYSQLKEVKNMAQAQHDASLALQQVNAQLRQQAQEVEEQYNNCLQQLSNMRTDEQQTQQRALELHAELMVKDRELRKLQDQAPTAMDVPVVDDEEKTRLQTSLALLQRKLAATEAQAIELKSANDASKAELIITVAALEHAKQQLPTAPATNGHSQSKTQLDKDIIVPQRDELKTAVGVCQGCGCLLHQLTLCLQLLQTELLALRERLRVDATAAQEVEASMVQQQSEFDAVRM
jgi:chromosome segregation ATPase